MADKKFADAALERFNAGSDASDEAPKAEKDSDDKLGRMLAAALRRGNGKAIVAAVRKICDGEYDETDDE